jgi:uncharacterized protein YbjT (DUF2867 family)
MYAVMGVTGRVGSAVSRALLGRTEPVRAIVRDASKSRGWAEPTSEVAVATLEDVASLTAAFRGAECVFVLVPPRFDPLPGFPEAIETGSNLRQALKAAGPERVVYLSTIGAQASRNNLLTQHTIIEHSLHRLPMPVTYLRPAWFMENAGWDIESARSRGVIESFLQPLDQPFPMVAMEDIGRTGADLMQQRWTGHRVVELEGPARLSPNRIAATLGKLLGRTVKTEAVPRESWEKLFRSRGMQNPGPRITMLDGFNEGWIELERRDVALKGRITLEEALRGLMNRMVEVAA